MWSHDPRRDISMWLFASGGAWPDGEPHHRMLSAGARQFLAFATGDEERALAAGRAVLPPELQKAAEALAQPVETEEAGEPKPFYWGPDDNLVVAQFGGPEAAARFVETHFKSSPRAAPRVRVVADAKLGGHHHHHRKHSAKEEGEEKRAPRMKRHVTEEAPGGADDPESPVEESSAAKKAASRLKRNVTQDAPGGSVDKSSTDRAARHAASSATGGDTVERPRTEHAPRDEPGSHHRRHAAPREHEPSARESRDAQPATPDRPRPGHEATHESAQDAKLEGKLSKGIVSKFVRRDRKAATVPAQETSPPQTQPEERTANQTPPEEPRQGLSKMIRGVIRSTK